MHAFIDLAEILLCVEAEAPVWAGALPRAAAVPGWRRMPPPVTRSAAVNMSSWSRPPDGGRATAKNGKALRVPGTIEVEM